jgi:hypothetical protein
MVGREQWDTSPTQRRRRGGSVLVTGGGGKSGQERPVVQRPQLARAVTTDASTAEAMSDVSTGILAHSKKVWQWLFPDGRCRQ